MKCVKIRKWFISKGHKSNIKTVKKKQSNKPKYKFTKVETIQRQNSTCLTINMLDGTWFDQEHKAHLAPSKYLCSQWTKPLKARIFICEYTTKKMGHIFFMCNILTGFQCASYTLVFSVLWLQTLKCSQEKWTIKIVDCEAKQWSFKRLKRKKNHTERSKH